MKQSVFINALPAWRDEIWRSKVDLKKKKSVLEGQMCRNPVLSDEVGIGAVGMLEQQVDL